MKFENKKPDAEKIAIHAQKQVEKQKILFTSTTKHKGHTMYEINCTTGDVAEVEYEEAKIVLVPHRDLITGAIIGSSAKAVMDINCKDNCIYIAALNKKSAKKKFLKYLLEKSQSPTK